MIGLVKLVQDKRAVLGLTSIEVAAAVGLSPTAMARILRGSPKPLRPRTVALLERWITEGSPRPILTMNQLHVEHQIVIIERAVAEIKRILGKP